MPRKSKRFTKQVLDLAKPVSKFTQKPIIIYADDAVRDAAKLMREKSTGSILVAENYGKRNEPIGILTEWDLLTKVVAAGKDPSNTTVRQVMSHPVRKIEADAEVSDALRIMINDGIRRLAVMQDGVLIGTITQSQIMSTRVRGTAIVPIVESVKGHICPYCALSFATRKKLSEHVNSMHEETVYLEFKARNEH